MSQVCLLIRRHIPSRQMSALISETETKIHLNLIFFLDSNNDKHYLQRMWNLEAKCGFSLSRSCYWSSVLKVPFSVDQTKIK